MEGGPNDAHVDDDGDGDEHHGPAREGGGGEGGDDGGDDGDGDAQLAWIRALAHALHRRAPLAEIRDVVLQQMPEAYRTEVAVGALILREVLKTSRCPPARAAGRRGGRGRQGRGGYPTLPMIKFLVEDVGWGPRLLSEFLDNDGYLALHVALIHKAPPNIVKYLLKSAPHVAFESPKRNSRLLSIHLAVDRSLAAGVDVDAGDGMAPWETVQCLLDAWPESIRHPLFGKIPLHHALKHLRRNRPTDRRVVRGLVERWPESVQWKTEVEPEQLALHVAVTGCVPVQDLRYLLNAHPPAIHARTRTWGGTSNDGYLPLHLAFVQPNGAVRPSGIAPLPTIRSLVEASPSTLLARTPLGGVALHLAFKSEAGDDPYDGPSLDLVQYLVEACPKSIRVANDKENVGWIALHFAASNPRTSPDVIRYLATKHPEAVAVWEDNPYRRRLPLHVAVESDLSVAGIVALIRAGPEALRARMTGSQADGELPLHALLQWGGHHRKQWRHHARHGNLLEAVKCLVAHGGPSILREKTSRRGETPLHVALLVTAAKFTPEEEEGDDHDDAVVEYLLEEWPESVREYTADKGWLAIHCASHRSRSPRALRSLLNLWPDSIRQLTRDNKQFLPIHLAATSWSTTPVPSLQLLLEAWPDSCLEWSGEGRLPIHYVAGDRGTPELVQCLLDCHPETVQMATRDGYLPIHLAALRRCDGCPDFWEARTRRFDVIRCLVTRQPDALMTPAASDGSLPLHCAFRSDTFDEDVINHLISACPESVRHRENTGSLPIHVALARAREEWGQFLGQLRRVVETLVNLHPDSLLVADSQGCLPLHLAAESQHASLDILYLLLRRRPDSIRGRRQEWSSRSGGAAADAASDAPRHGRRRPGTTAIPSRGRRGAATPAAKRRRSDAAP